MTTDNLFSKEVDTGITMMKDGMDANNMTQVNDGLGKVANALGIDLPFKNLADFDKFMSDPNRTLIL